MYERAGKGPTALVFVHGWMGTRRWWDAQRDALSDRYTIVQLDLGGHAASGRRAAPSAEGYVADIVAVANAIEAERIVLVGHSMSGAYTALAVPRLPKVVALVLVDTLKDVEQRIPKEQLDQMLGMYRQDYRNAVENVLPQYLFAPGTPPAVKARLQAELLTRSGDEAAALLEPLYGIDLPAAARAVSVPVRAINSDAQPTAVETNRRHFRDFDARILAGVGHYPMLEEPDAFTSELRATLAGLGLGA